MVFNSAKSVQARVGYVLSCVTSDQWPFFIFLIPFGFTCLAPVEFILGILSICMLESFWSHIGITICLFIFGSGVHPLFCRSPSTAKTFVLSGLTGSRRKALSSWTLIECIICLYLLISLLNTSMLQPRSAPFHLRSLNNWQIHFVSSIWNFQVL